MKTTTPDRARQENLSEGILSHLNLALQADMVEEKNFHIRTALQFHFGAFDERPQTKSAGDQQDDSPSGES